MLFDFVLGDAANMACQQLAPGSMQLVTIVREKEIDVRLLFRSQGLWKRERRFRLSEALLARLTLSPVNIANRDRRKDRIDPLQNARFEELQLLHPDRMINPHLQLAVTQSKRLGMSSGLRPHNTLPDRPDAILFQLFPDAQAPGQSVEDGARRCGTKHSGTAFVGTHGRRPR